VVNRDLIRLGAKCELAKREFFFYCCLKSNDFYKEDRTYLKNICDNLQGFYYGNDDVLVLNVPPR
jgi:hypothetical protein